VSGDWTNLGSSSLDVEHIFPNVGGAFGTFRLVAGAGELSGSASGPIFASALDVADGTGDFLGATGQLALTGAISPPLAPGTISAFTGSISGAIEIPAQ
jgi:hypothetical protein